MNIGGRIEQWVSKILGVSSEYSTGWGADTIIGEPRVYPRYGDNAGSERNETYNPGAIYKISCRRCDISGISEDEWNTIYSKPHNPQVEKKSRIFSPRIRLPKDGILTREIRLDLHCFATVGWSEIDAVQIVGTNQGVVSGIKLTNFSSQMKSMLYDEVFPDVVFRFTANGREIKGHRGLIASRCPIFRSIFRKGKIALKSSLFSKNSPKEEEEEVEGEEVEGEEPEEEEEAEEIFKKEVMPKETTVEDLMKKEILVVSMDESMNPDVFMLFLEFLYTNTVQVSEDLIFPLFDLAGKFKMRELSEYLNKYCEFMIGIDNVIHMVRIVREEIMKNPKTPNLFLTQLKLKCLDFIAEEHSEIVQEREFGGLQKDEILYVCRKISKDCSKGED